MPQSVASNGYLRGIRRTMALRYPLQELPFRLVMSYLLAVFAIFLVWPINWQIYSTWAWIALIGYVVVCFAAIAVGYRAGTALTVRGSRPFAEVRVELFIALGAIASIVLLFPLSYVYTGRWPWQVGAALVDQGEAYRQLYGQLAETSGQRGSIAFARAMLAPLTFAVIPLGLLHWRGLTWLYRGLVIATALSTVVLSLLRGTDRELAELLMLSTSALLVVLARTGGSQALALFKRYWKPGLLLIVFLLVAASLFTQRKSERLGGNENELNACANISRICADIDAPLISWMPFRQRFGVSMFVLSTASGFYGLALGMEKDFQPAWGVGHSPVAMAVYELVTGDREFRTRTYTFRNTFDGWSEESYWSTLILWLANDVGFAGAVLLIGLLSFMWGRSWRDATIGRSDAAAVMFCVSMIMFIYLPANNQIFLSYDGYAIFFFWLILWMRRSGGRSTAGSALPRS